ncbi:MAG: hypothetical protein HY518_00795, partial [Candidatus Aenigmarchaeota archaeon]|nr:hypothetical protein [Candidatus Aenigmarchaeota archaeon]
MRALIAAFVAAIVLSAPLGFAQVSGSAGAISVFDLRLKQIGQAFGDFVFNVRAVLTFDEDAKLDLLEERNAQLQARQQTWVDVKAEAMTQFESGNLTVEEKKEIKETIQAEHEAIIREHLRLTAELKELQLNARARGNADLDERANVAANAAGRSGLSLG